MIQPRSSRAGSLSAAAAHDLVSVGYTFVDPADGCGGPAIAQTTVALEDENLPTSVQPAGGGDSHRFAEGRRLVLGPLLRFSGEEGRPERRLSSYFDAALPTVQPGA